MAFDREGQLKKPWKVLPCSSGEQCWCRPVVTVDYDEDTNTDNLEVVWPEGAVAKEVAEHVVALHNQFIVANAVHQRTVDATFGREQYIEMVDRHHQACKAVVERRKADDSGT